MSEKLVADKGVLDNVVGFYILAVSRPRYGIFERRGGRVKRTRALISRRLSTIIVVNLRSLRRWRRGSGGTRMLDGRHWTV